MFKKICMTVVLLSSVIYLSGCVLLAAGAAGVGTAKWLSDKVTQEINSPLAKVVKAAEDSLTGAGTKIYKETSATDVTQIRAKDVNDKQIWVDIRPIDSNHTKVDVRVGWANGDQDARKIIENIVSRS